MATRPTTDAQGSTTIEVEDFGAARIRVVVGSTGSGRPKPCVQIEFSHDLLDGVVAAVALSPKEAHNLQLALAIAQNRIKDNKKAPMELPTVTIGL